MRIDAALVREQGVTFAVVLVKESANQPGAREQVATGARRLFPGVPVVLASVSAAGRVKYWGRPDLSRFCASLPFQALPWATYTT